MVIGLTGFYCSGKSTAEYFLQKNFGFYIIDMDHIGHEVQLLPEVKKKIAAQFGSNVLTSDGLIDRKILGAIVFSDQKKLESLNSLMKPFMQARLEEILKQHEQEVVILSAALLFDAGLDHYCSKVLVVRSSIWRIFFRAWKRDQHSFARTWKTLRSQKLKEYINQRANSVDIVFINTNGTPNQLEKKLLKVLKKNE